jgi:hypothetical protein
MRYDDYDGYLRGGSINIASGNAVVGAQIGGEPQGVQVFAWLKDSHGDLWILTGRHAEGGVYSKGTSQYDTSTTIHGIDVSDTRTAVLGPKVWIV